MADNVSSKVKAFDVCFPGCHGDVDLSRHNKAVDRIKEEINFESVLKFLPELMSCFAHK